MSGFDRNKVTVSTQAHLVRPGDEYCEISLEPPREPTGPWREVESNETVEGCSMIVSTDGYVLTQWPTWRHVGWRKKA